MLLRSHIAIRAGVGVEQGRLGTLLYRNDLG